MFLYNPLYVPIAELDNASPSEGEDCGFESRWAHQQKRFKNMQLRLLFALLVSVSVTACNRLYIKPQTLEQNATIYTTRGGYSMRAATKAILEERGYDIKIGKIKESDDITETELYESETFYIPNNAKYVLKISESKDLFRPIWCAFNGFWWWRYNISLVDQQQGKELLIWTGRNCTNTAQRKLNKILDQLEITDEQ